MRPDWVFENTMSATFSVPASPKNRISCTSCLRLFCNPRILVGTSSSNELLTRYSSDFPYPPQGAVSLFELVGHGVGCEAGDRLTRADQRLEALLEEIARDGRRQHVQRAHADLRYTGRALRDQDW